jgi:predicted nuclease of predicted toxin-antitoxin system
MKVLFDQGTPAPLRKALGTHWVETANERGWSELQNGDLIAVAETNGFEVFVTTDRNLKYQQNFTGRQSAIVVLLTTTWPRRRQALPAVVEAVEAATPGSYREVKVPSAI